MEGEWQVKKKLSRKSKPNGNRSSESLKTFARGGSRLPSLRQRYCMKAKTCTKCLQTKPIEDFYLKYDKRRPNDRKSSCKSCHEAKLLAKRTAEKRELKEWAIDYLGGKCSNNDCPIAHLDLPNIIMEFHHEDPNVKECNISQMIFSRRSKNEIQIELDKCVLLCVICHRLLHTS